MNNENYKEVQVLISKAEQQIKGNHFCLKGKTAEGRYHPLLY